MNCNIEQQTKMGAGERFFHFLPSTSLFFAAVLLLYCTTAFSSNLVYADYVDSAVVDEISYFSKKAGLERKFTKISEGVPSRVEWAKFLNEVYWTIENKNISLSREEEKRLENLIKYFDTEYLILNLSHSLEQRPIFKLSAQYSINSEYLWGEDVRTSVLAIYQQLRLKFSVQKKNTLGYLALRNFGFWGVNEYSSGSVGIDFKTSDPPFIEQLYIESGELFRVTAGRKYFHTGIWGLSINWLYLPLDLLRFGYHSKNFSVWCGAASRYENIDYYIASLGYNTDKMLFTEISGFCSAINQLTLEKLGSEIENDLGASFAISLKPVEFLSLKNEVALYKKNISARELYPFISAVEFDSNDFALVCRYSRLPDVKFPSYGIAQPPLDFIDKDYIGIRFRPNTQGYNVIVNLRYAAPVFTEVEHTRLEMLDSEDVYYINSMRGFYRSFKDDSIIDRAIVEISVVNFDGTEKDTQEWRFKTQFSVKF